MIITSEITIKIRTVQPDIVFLMEVLKKYYEINREFSSELSFQLRYEVRICIKRGGGFVKASQMKWVLFFEQSILIHSGFLGYVE